MSVNKVILVGNLGKDPELRYTQSGVAVATFSIATTEKFKDREGNRQENTTWHNIVAWKQLAEICGKWLKKGKQIYCEGKIQTRNYDDKNGEKKYITEIVIHDIKMLGSRNDNHGSQQNNNDRSAQQQNNGQDGPRSNAGGQSQSQAYGDQHQQGVGQQNVNSDGGYSDTAYDSGAELPF